MPNPKPAVTPRVGLASLPDIQFKKADVDRVVNEATKTVAASMGVSPDQLPTAVVDAIRTSTTSAMNIRTKALIQRNVDSTVKETVLKGAKPLDMLDARVQAARDGIAHISQDAKVEEVLNDTAALLRKKFSALKAAGFTEEQAFDLVLAEVQGRAARNR